MTKQERRIRIPHFYRGLVGTAARIIGRHRIGARGRNGKRGRCAVITPEIIGVAGCSRKNQRTVHTHHGIRTQAEFAVGENDRGSQALLTERTVAFHCGGDRRRTGLPCRRTAFPPAAAKKQFRRARSGRQVAHEEKKGAHKGESTPVLTNGSKAPRCSVPRNESHTFDTLLLPEHWWAHPRFTRKLISS